MTTPPSDSAYLLEIAQRINDTIAHSLIALTVASRGLLRDLEAEKGDLDLQRVIGQIEAEAHRGFDLARELDRALIGHLAPCRRPRPTLGDLERHESNETNP